MQTGRQVPLPGTRHLAPENAASWNFVAGTPTASEGTFRFHAPVGGTAAFYRLIKPAN